MEAEMHALHVRSCDWGVQRNAYQTLVHQTVSQRNSENWK